MQLWTAETRRLTKQVNQVRNIEVCEGRRVSGPRKNSMETIDAYVFLASGTDGCTSGHWALKDYL